MKKISFLTFVLICLFVKAQNYSGGNGTGLNPYQIATLSDLVYLSEHSSDFSYHYIQTVDIDASSTSSLNGTQGFKPIGFSTAFGGSYDGNNKKIINLTSHRNNSVNIGLFGETSSTAIIKNINLEGGSFKGDMFVGSLVGYANGNITNCKSSATVSGNKHIGGLIGYGKGTINYCNASGFVTSNHESGIPAGLVGTALGPINNCIATGDVINTNFNGSAGGLVGTSSSTINFSHATGNVTAGYLNGHAAGLAVINSALVSNCYSNGNVTGKLAAGLIANSYNDISKSFATGSISGDEASGLVGKVRHSAGFSYLTYISECFSTCNVSGQKTAGLIIENLDSQVLNLSNCYSVCTLTSNTGCVSGLVYKTNNTANLGNSYFAGAINGNCKVGLIWSVGSNNTNNFLYWDSELSTATIGSGTNNTIGSRTTSEMKTQSTFVGFNFNTIWKINPLINNGYPFLEFSENFLKTEDEVFLSDESILIYPSYIKNGETLSIKTLDNITDYSIHNMLGQNIKFESTNSKTLSITLDNLKVGVYIINIKTQKRYYSKKFIIK